MDKKLEIAIINRFMDMRKLIESRGHWVAPNGMHFCVFHENDDTKAAKLYENEGGGQVFCFAEYRQYTPYDYYKILEPDINTTELAQLLFDKLTPEKQEEFKNNINQDTEFETLPYLRELEEFKEGTRTFEQLLVAISESYSNDTLFNTIDYLYKLKEVPKFDSTDKYLYYMNNYNTNYKLMSSYALLRSANTLPDFVVQHLNSVGDVVLIPHIINKKVMSLTFRSIRSDKRFLKYGEFSSLMYGLGSFPLNFSYGTSVIISEGNIDSDFIRTIYPYSLASLTSSLTSNHVELLRNLTNHVILAFDNDEAGNRAFYSARKKLKGMKVSRFEHNVGMKDFGDLLELQFRNSPDFELIYNDYKSRINLLLDS